MPKEIRVGPASRLIKAVDFRLFSGKAGAPIDFSRDHVVILDEDCRPVAECWPIDDETGVPPKPAVSSALKPPGPSAGNHVPNHNQSLGRLTEAQREMLERLWKDHPNASPDLIGEKFEQQAGRTVSCLTVNSYRPGAAR